MEQRIFIGENNTATFICPECNASKSKDVSEYKSLDRRLNLKVTCPCGNTYAVFLERRRTYRRQTDLPGTFFYKPAGGRPQKGQVSVMDISQTGLKLKFMMMPKISIGAIFEVEFMLDDKNHTLIKKEVAVMRIADNILGAKFCSTDPSDPCDKAIGFYLF